ncbi:serine/threonine-protein kinase SMG1-like [Prunus yedoensis var. nudiflora]|uniref:Serine/threonine-protein kinase SMG1-like n=1 Tax=Prunus yedoensis var. nudiflora TaxID=2094558 RepID=A0A314XYS3_PRUYE|nr:serine/threonine-protein kinase SMG1-like [Prunus yedoensis var. nudiflora]
MNKTQAQKHNFVAIDRLAAINSLHRAVLYPPPNSLLVTHSASFLAQGFSQLLSDKFLFDFVEALKKNVYNAYEGSAVLLSATCSSSLFFRARRKLVRSGFLNPGYQSCKHFVLSMLGRVIAVFSQQWAMKLMQFIPWHGMIRVNFRQHGHDLV